MRHALCLVLLAGLTVPLALSAQQADGVPAQKGSATKILQPAAPPPVNPADPMRDALIQLARERQSWVQAFDWNQQGTPVERARRYAEGMRSFRVRELQLQLQRYRGQGRADLLARTQVALDRLQSEPLVLPDLDPAHELAPTQQQEPTR